MAGTHRKSWAIIAAAVGISTMMLLAGHHARAAADQPTQARVGGAAPDFTLKDTTGKTWKLSELTRQGKIVVLEWFNPQCPYVRKHYTKRTQMNDTAKKYAGRGVVWLAVNSSHHEDAAFSAKWKKRWNVNHPILVDQSGKVGRAYGARTTPDMFIINKDGVLVYEGAIDNEPSPRITRQGDDYTNYVDKALANLLSGKEIDPKETRSYGCSVKYGR